MPHRSTQILPYGAGESRTPIGTVVLAHDQRHVRRKLLHMVDDDVVMLDLKEPVQLGHGDLLLTEAGETIEVDAETYEVRADGELLTCQPASVLPMAQRYFLF